MTSRGHSIYALSILVLCCIPTLADSDASALDPIPNGLPASLDALYPPHSTRPSYLIAMHDLNASLTGVAVDAMENDLAGAALRFDEFAAFYVDTAAMVPEWEPFYPQAPVTALKQAIEAGDPGQIMAAVAKAGETCHHCHLATMVPAQQRFHWPDFGQVEVDDPVSGTRMPFAGFMQMLNASMVGIGVDLKESDPANARMHLTAFRSRMQALRESCAACHDTERRYFVDEDIELLLSGLAAAMDAPRVDASSIDHLTRRVGEEACSRCHLVHLPAAYSGAGAR